MFLASNDTKNWNSAILPLVSNFWEDCSHVASVQVSLCIVESVLLAVTLKCIVLPISFLDSSSKPFVAIVRLPSSREKLKIESVSTWTHLSLVNYCKVYFIGHLLFLWMNYERIFILSLETIWWVKYLSAAFGKAIRS